MEKGAGVMHLVVYDTESLDLYDPVWLPHEIKRVKIGEERIEIQAVVLESIHSFTLSGSKDSENRVSGTLAMKYPQWTSTVRFNGLKVSKTPFPNPVEWVSRHREGKTINAVEYCLKRAPRDDFDSFERFWEEEFEPSFYIFLHNALYGPHNSESAKKSGLKRLFHSIEFYTKECIEAGTSEILSVGDTAEASEGGEHTQADCLVLMPGAFATEQTTQQVASIKNQFPPGYSPCCGDSLYTLETFEIHFLDCPSLSSPVEIRKETSEVEETLKPVEEKAESEQSTREP